MATHRRASTPRYSTQLSNGVRARAIRASPVSRVFSERYAPMNRLRMFDVTRWAGTLAYVPGEQPQ